MGVGRRRASASPGRPDRAMPALATTPTTRKAFSTYGIVPAGGDLDQTATLQLAADEAAEPERRSSFPPASIPRALSTLKSGTQIEGVPGRSILRYREGDAIVRMTQAENVRLAGLVLDGGRKELPDAGALLAATEIKHLDIADCRFLGSTKDGVVLRKVSGRVKDCEIGDIRKDRTVQRGRGRAGDRAQPCARLRRQRHSGVALRARRRRHHRRCEPYRAHRRQERRQRPERQRHQRVPRGLGDCQRQPHRRLRLFRHPLEFRLELPDDRQFLQSARRGRALCRVLLRRRHHRQQHGRQGGDRHRRHQFQRRRQARRGARQSHPQSRASARMSTAAASASPSKPTAW